MSAMLSLLSNMFSIGDIAWLLRAISQLEGKARQLHDHISALKHCKDRTLRFIFICHRDGGLLYLALNVRAEPLAIIHASRELNIADPFQWCITRHQTTLGLVSSRISELYQELGKLRLLESIEHISLLLASMWECLCWQVHEMFHFGSKAKWFPNRRRPPCSTMPWMIRASLVVLWGVCWMFYGLSPRSSFRKLTIYFKDGS